MPTYNEFHRRSLAEREAFWAEEARAIHWQRPFDRVLFVDLRGFHPDPAQPPADPGAVLEQLVRLDPDVVMPEGLDMVPCDRAAVLLAASRPERSRPGKSRRRS